MELLYIIRFAFISLAALAVFAILFLLRIQKRRKEKEVLDEHYFLIFLLIKRLNEELKECKGLISQKNYDELKKTIDKIQMDFFSK